MFRMLMIGAVSALTLSAAAFAQQGGTAQEARAMLDKAAAVKADQAVALAMFIKGEGSPNRWLEWRPAPIHLRERPHCTKVNRVKCGFLLVH